MRAVLEAAADRAGWGRGLSDGVFSVGHQCQGPMPDILELAQLDTVRAVPAANPLPGKTVRVKADRKSATGNSPTEAHPLDTGTGNGTGASAKTVVSDLTDYGLCIEYDVSQPFLCT